MRLKKGDTAMRLKLWVFVLLVCAAVPTAAGGAKLAGKVLDAAAFGKVKTYCVDTSNLIKEAVNPVEGRQDFPQPEAFDVREEMKRESEPQGLLSKLPWKLGADCSAPDVDAIVHFDFRLVPGILVLAPAGGENSQPRPPAQNYWRADIQVSDKASSRVIYKAEGNPLDYRLERTTTTVEELRHVQRQLAAYYALAALVSDVKTISKNP